MTRQRESFCCLTSRRQFLCVDYFCRKLEACWFLNTSFDYWKCTSGKEGEEKVSKNWGFCGASWWCRARGALEEAIDGEAVMANERQKFVASSNQPWKPRKKKPSSHSFCIVRAFCCCRRTFCGPFWIWVSGLFSSLFSLLDMYQLALNFSSFAWHRTHNRSLWCPSIMSVLGKGRQKLPSSDGQQNG